ncbi:MAG: hypothetical protein O2819_03745 [Planctomycetota bacterium]|nr:hypothetical protein [Planctomycetota bacterium]
MTDEALLARQVGRFFGEIWRGMKADPNAGEPVRIEVRRTVQEREVDDLTLRRTTIDEVEVKKPCDSKNQH